MVKSNLCTVHFLRFFLIIFLIRSSIPQKLILSWICNTNVSITCLSVKKLTTNWKCSMETKCCSLKGFLASIKIGIISVIYGLLIKIVSYWNLIDLLALTSKYQKISQMFTAWKVSGFGVVLVPIRSECT